MATGNPEGKQRPPEEQRLGPVLRRREQVQAEHDRPAAAGHRAAPSDWVHTDPWRVLRIQSEFVEGFGTLAELRRAISVFGSARTPAGLAGVRGGRAASAGRWSRPGFAVITGGGPGAMEAANKGACEAKRHLGRPRHRAALRAGAQPVRRHRRELPLLLRPQDDVREVRAGLRRPARRPRHPGRAVRGADPRPDPEGHPLPDRPVRHGVLGRPGRLAAGTRWSPRARRPRRTCCSSTSRTTWTRRWRW